MMKKLFLAAISLATVSCLALGLVACGGGDKDPSASHEHTYASELSSNAVYHYYAATCEHTSEKQDKVEHTFEENVCTVCGYELHESVGLEFAEREDGEGYYVSGLGTCTGSDIVIPATFAGKPVTRIDDYAFSNKSSLKSVVIPDGVTSIGWCAFFDSGSLESVLIPNSVTVIADGAFRGCTSLEDIVIPDSVTSIGERSFYQCVSLKSVVIGEGVTKIGRNAFYYCSSLENLVIGKGVTSIGGSAISFCTSLRNIEYTGTMAEWQEISLDDWAVNTHALTITCTDGTLKTLPHGQME